MQKESIVETHLGKIGGSVQTFCSSPSWSFNNFNFNKWISFKECTKPLANVIRTSQLHVRRTGASVHQQFFLPEQNAWDHSQWLRLLTFCGDFRWKSNPVNFHVIHVDSINININPSEFRNSLKIEGDPFGFWRSHESQNLQRFGISGRKPPCLRHPGFTRREKNTAGHLDFRGKNHLYSW